jgi:hypothetical protein
MKSILLLYDTQEEDLARDFKDFLNELEVNVEMIPLAPNKGKTLQDKEEHFFDSADGAIFLITPRIESSPSSSVSHEMGQAKQKFKNKPEKVIYLVDKNCTVSTIDQKSYIKFDRDNIRSIIKAITSLIKDLKLAGWLGNKQEEQKEASVIDIAKYAESIDEFLKKICIDLSKQPNGFITFTEFDKLLQFKHNMNQQDINFAKIDLTKKELAAYRPIPPLSPTGLQLIGKGWELVRYEKEEQKKRQISTHHYGLLDNSPTPMSLLERSLLGGIKKNEP